MTDERCPTCGRGDLDLNPHYHPLSEVRGAITGTPEPLQNVTELSPQDPDWAVGENDDDVDECVRCGVEFWGEHDCHTPPIGEPVIASLRPVADRLAPVGRQLCEAGWTAEMIARHDPDSGRVTLSLEVELKTTRNPRGRGSGMSDERETLGWVDGVVFRSEVPQDGDEIEPLDMPVEDAFGTIKAALAWAPENYGAPGYRDFALAALATIHRTMEGLREERDEAVASSSDWHRWHGEATSRAEQAEAERDRGRDRDGVRDGARPDKITNALAIIKLGRAEQAEAERER
jgi:hypothetical protein